MGWGQQLPKLEARPSRAGNENLPSQELTFLRSLNTNFLQEEFEVVSFVFFSLILFQKPFALDMVSPRSVTSNFSLIDI